MLAPDSPRFTILAVIHAYLRVTTTRRSELIGQALFEVFPDYLNDPARTAAKNLQA